MINLQAGAGGVVPSNGVYLDTCFLIDCYIAPEENSKEAKKATAAKNILAKLLMAGINLYVSSLAFDEAWFTLFKLIHRREEGRNSWHHNILKHKPFLINQYAPEIKKFKLFVDKLPNAHKIGVPGQIIDKAFEIMFTAELEPRDSFHLSLVLHNGLSCIISRDKDFLPFRKIDSNLSVLTY